MNQQAKEIHEKLYGKPLDCKKNIREYIDIIKKQSKEGLEAEAVSAVYEHIEQAINEFAAQVKANTAVQLKKELQGQLGAFKKKESQKEEIQNPFIKFFKDAYPRGTRNKEYTVVLMDEQTISPDQILTTLKYINRHCKDNRLTSSQKASIYPMVEKVLATNNIKLINQVKSLEWLLKKANFRVKPLGRGYTVHINHQS
ncbi:MAG: hypothetical protein ACRCTE_06155 [Cellulosilyticaceae bacterium]